MANGVQRYQEHRDQVSEDRQVSEGSSIRESMDREEPVQKAASPNWPTFITGHLYT